MIPKSPISRMALLQSLVIVIGVFTTGIVLKLHMYPESSLDWNPASVAVRNYGYLLLLVPAAWAVACVVLERCRTNLWSPTRTLISGIVIITLLIGFLWWTTEKPYFEQPETIGPGW